MAVTGTRVTVTGGSATKIADATDTDNVSGVQVVVKNTDGAIVVDLGGSAVATGAGFPLAAGATSPSINLEPGESLYAVQASGSPVVAVLKTGA